MPASHETIDARQHYVKQDGQTVFKFAVRKTEEISRRVLERNGLQPSDVDLFVSHQANRRIIKAAAERLGLPDEKVIINLERFGNTTGATIPLALADAVAEKKLKRGDLVLLASVGAGFTVGAVLLRWGYLEGTSAGQARRAGRVRPERRSDLVDQQLRVVAHRVADDDHGVVLRALEPDPRRVRGIRGDDVRAHRLHDAERVFDRRRRNHRELQLDQHRAGHVADSRVIADDHHQRCQALDVGSPSPAARLAPAICPGANILHICHSQAILVQVLRLRVRPRSDRGPTPSLDRTVIVATNR